jgi:hypothetical protein
MPAVGKQLAISKETACYQFVQAISWSAEGQQLICSWPAAVQQLVAGKQVGNSWPAFG